MRLHTMFWFVVLVSFCDKGYFKEEFKILCVILTLPGSMQRKDPSELKPLWDKTLSFIGEDKFRSSNMEENLQIAKKRCEGSASDDDLSCAFIDFVTIGNLDGDDALNLKNMFSSKSQNLQYYYDLYIGAWLMHPRIARLGCGPPFKHLWQFLNTMLSLKSFHDYFDIKTLFGNITSKGLRQEIDRLCPVWSTEKICMFRRWTNIADKIDKLLTYVTREQWKSSSFKMLKNTMQLYFYASQLQILNWHRSSGTRVFAYRLASKVEIWVKDITKYIFESLQNNDIDLLRPVLELLPYTVHLPCDDTAEFQSMDRTMCTFKSMIDSLSWYLAGTNTRGNIKLISTTVDYEKFLQQRRFEQILNIAETTQHNLLLVADNLKAALKNNFGELSNYFQTLAEFDQNKALIDINGITSDLDKYKKASDQSSTKLNSLMKKNNKCSIDGDDWRPSRSLSRI